MSQSLRSRWTSAHSIIGLARYVIGSNSRKETLSLLIVVDKAGDLPCGDLELYVHRLSLAKSSLNVVVPRGGLSQILLAFACPFILLLGVLRLVHFCNARVRIGCIL